MTTLTRADMAALDALERDELAVARAARLVRAALRRLRQGGDAGGERVRIRYVARKAAPSWRARSALGMLFCRLLLGAWWRDTLCDITVDAIETSYRHADEGRVRDVQFRRAPWRITATGPVLVGSKARRISCGD